MSAPTPFTSPPPARPEAVVPPADPTDPTDPPRIWSGWMGPVALIAALVVSNVLGLIAVGIIHVLGANTSHPDKGGVAIALTYVQDASWIVVVLFMAHVTADAVARPIRPAALGVRVPELGRTIRWVGIAVALYAVFSLAFANLVHTKSDNIFHSLGVHRSSAGTVAALAVLVCVAAPIAEELLFRGFMFAALASWGPWVAAVIVGLLFGAVHAIGTPAILLIQLAVLGFLLCLVRWRTGSILPTVALHSINNSLAIGTLVHWTWQIPLLLIGAVPLAVGTVFVFALPEWRRRRAVT